MSFDTYEIVKKLKAAGFSEAQAEGVWMLCVMRAMLIYPLYRQKAT